jgi:uncharacterized protein (DUF1697 family)
MNMQYVTFLRAINVAGHAIVKMTDLKSAFECAGCANVETLIQSGNVVFESAEKKRTALFQNIQTELRSLVGDQPVLMTRTARELERVMEAAPFKRSKAPPDAKLYVAFLARKPTSRPKFPLVLPKEELEAIAMTDREVFIVSRRKKNGFYGFPNNFIEKELGVSATTRNWSTVTKIVDQLREGKSSISNQPPAITGSAATRLRTSSSGRTGSGRRK